MSRDEDESNVSVPWDYGAGRTAFAPTPLNERELIGPDDISPLLRSIGGYVVSMATDIATDTGRHGLMRVSLAPELGPMIGVRPGSSCDVMTPAGRVEVYVEATPRSEGTAKID